MRKTFCKFVIVLTAFFALATLSAMAQPWWTATANWNGAPGSITDNGDGTATFTAGGNEIWGGNDTGFFAYAPVTGDFDVAMRNFSVEAVPTGTPPEGTQGDASWARMGFMARESGASSTARYIMQQHAPSGSYTIASIVTITNLVGDPPVEVYTYTTNYNLNAGQDQLGSLLEGQRWRFRQPGCLGLS